MHRIGIAAAEYNKGAVKLYERLGFTQEGRLRECNWHDGGFWDVVLFSMLEDEWRERYGKQELNKS